MKKTSCILGVMSIIFIFINLTGCEEGYNGIKKEKIFEVVEDNQELILKAVEETNTIDTYMNNLAEKNNLTRIYACVYSCEGFEQEIKNYDVGTFLNKDIDKDYRGLILYGEFTDGRDGGNCTYTYEKFENKIFEQLSELGVKKIISPEDSYFHQLQIEFASSVYNQSSLRKYGIVYCDTDNPKDLFTSGDWNIETTTKGIKATYTMKDIGFEEESEYIIEKICDNIYYYRETN